MGALGLSIDLTIRPADADDLLHEAWDVIADRMSRLADTSASEEILAYYLEIQSSDSFANGNWAVHGTSLMYSFSDAAGNCVVEMYACSHWASLTVLDQWDKLVSVAARHGSELILPGPVTAAGVSPEQHLRSILTGRSNQVFFHHYIDEDRDDSERLGYAYLSSTPADDHELRFYALDGPVRPLSGTGADRDRLTTLITTGQCACDVCQNLRYFRDLPRARHQFE